MKPQVKSIKAKIKALEKKVKAIEQKNTSIKFYTAQTTELRNDLNKHYEIVKQMIYLKVDLKFCPTENRNEMCSNCDCWKINAY
jgi:uncharacterized sporulation protein YeaH/YhbH (DUF444 family)